MHKIRKLVLSSPALLSFSILSFSILSFSILSSTASAEVANGEIEELVVTADFRETGELSTPHSLSIISEQVIRARAAQHFEDIINAVPNVNYASGTGRARYFQIRGIGERSQFADPINPSVGVLIDGVDFSGAASVATLFDVDQVEVLRGPQGTRYGANALAGLINIKTNDPAPEFDARFKASTAEYATRTVGAVITGPLGDTVAGRLTAEKHESDGYTYNAFLDRDDVNYRDETTLRGKLALRPSASWRTDLSLSWVDIDNGYDAFSLDNTRTTLSDEPGHDRQESVALSIDSTWQLDGFDVQLLATAADSDIEYGYDEDWTYVGIHPDAYSSTDNYIRDRRTRSLELRLLTGEWVVGVYALDQTEDLRRVYTYLPSDFFSTYEFTTTALFARNDRSLTDRFNLSTGLRVERRDSSYVDSDAIAFDPEDTMWGGTIALQYRHPGSLMSYVSLARGYKAGGFNTDGSLDADLREFGAEYLWEIEAGTKGMALENRLQLRVAVFYDIRRDQQVKSSIVRTRPGGSTEFIDFLGNAAEGNNRGLEIETDWHVSDTVSVFANLGLLKAKFDEFINEFGDDLSGREQAQAPNYMYNVGIDYAGDAWFWRLSVDGKDEFFFSDRHNLRSRAYALVNARAGYAGNGWQISLWGRNLTDKDYTVRGFGSFGNDPRKGYIVEPYVQFGEPRIVGITFDYQLNGGR